MVSSSRAASEDATDDRRLVWTVWPARHRPATTILVVAVVLVAAAFAGELMESVVAGLVAGLFLVHALRQFFFPTIYRIDSSGVSTRCLAHVAQLPWRRIRRLKHDEQGAFLSTRARSGFLDRFSGLHLSWNANHEEAVRFIEDFMSLRIELISRHALASGFHKRTVG